MRIDAPSTSQSLPIVRPGRYDKHPMVSALHEDMLQLVRDHPAFVAELLGRVLRIDLPGFREARLADSALNQAVPVEHRADAVVVFTDERPVFGAIIEAQLRRDEDKLFTWPLYAVTARERHRCPFIVIVVTPDPATAIWAARRVDLGGGVHYWPAVIGPDAIPKVTDRDQARREPYLAVLSVLAHGQGDLETASAIGSAAAWAILPFPEDKRTVYSRMIEAHLSEAARKAIEMQPELKTFFSEAQRQNDERVRAEGRAEGRTEILLKFLSLRGLTLTAEQRRRISVCTDAATLDQWLERSLTVSSADELFA
jgi:hypothetical protein